MGWNGTQEAQEAQERIFLVPLVLLVFRSLISGMLRHRNRCRWGSRHGRWILRHDGPAHEVRDDSGNWRKDGGKNPQHPDQRHIQIKVSGDAAADTCDFPIPDPAQRPRFVYLAGRWL